MSFCSLLTVLFIALKLCGVISWSWWLVLLPLYALLLIPVVAFVISFLYVLKADE